MMLLIEEQEKLEKVAFILKTIGHPVRLKILSLLSENQQMSVNEISERCEVEQSLISHHLTNMKLKGVLQSERDGKSIFYSIKLMEVLNVVECMSKCRI
ncbi:ArsR/SmtB family transcription factor [Reichenbachiella sp.]|uniref:ArsR/SmtB family transcription factor n=1 Tax=Reichenbachiella sp. TaxID=2184521 RepID=UPI003B5ABA05